MWRVYDAVENREFILGSFFPTNVFLSQYVPFFPQYALNISFFSPDSNWIVFACEKNEPSIYVQEIREGSVPTKVAEGNFATWSVQ